MIGLNELKGLKAIEISDKGIVALKGICKARDFRKKEVC
jgi:hypothetical protein